MALAPAFLDGIGFSEMLVIAFLAILVFGGKLPDALKNVGRSYAKFRKGLHDVSRPLRDEIQRATTLPADTFVPTLPATTPTTPPAPAPYDVGVPAEGGGAPGPAPEATSPVDPPPAPPGAVPPAPSRPDR